MKSKIAAAAAALVCAAAAFALPETPVPMVDHCPMIDGQLDDALWQDAVELGPFTARYSGVQVADTRARLARDDRWLYIAVECDNPHMDFLNQLGRTRDDPVFTDDSIEIFISRDGLNRYFHYALNFANIQAERRIVGTGRDFGWNYPWVSATVRTDKGWNAEIAIPMDAVNGDQPGDIRFNLLRNRIDVELDEMGAKHAEKKVNSFWAPVAKSAHEPERFGRLTGLSDFCAAPPFLPQIAGLQTGNMDISGEQLKFEILADIVGRSPVPGRARLEVVEYGTNGPATLISQEYDLPERCEQTFSLVVLVSDFRARSLALRLTDTASGMRMDERKLDYRGNLIAAAYPEFSFYATEAALRVKIVLNMAEKTLPGLALVLQDARGRMVSQADKLSAPTVLVAKADVLQPGENQLSVVLKNDSGKTLGTYPVKVVKLAPGSGAGTKVDYFKRVVCLNGAPFFPFGMYANGLLREEAVIDEVMRRVASAGMNTIIGGSSVDLRGEDPASKVRDLARTAARHGLRFGFWNNIHALHTDFPSGRLPLPDKKAIAAKAYSAKFQRNLEKTAAALRDEPGMLFWYGWDEPNLNDWQLNLFVQKLYFETARQADPYHVMFGLYARYIPPVPEAVAYFDVLGYDVYTYTQWEGQHADVCGAMAAQTAQLDVRAAENRHPVWMVPMGTALDPVRVPRVLSGPEQICQSYAAIIYGARGLLYFHYGSTYGKETWAALRELGNQIREFAPAVLNDPVDQDIRYKSGNYDILRWQCPPVPFRFFRFPDGRLIALAVNARNCPVDAVYKITGLRSVHRLDGAGESFDDKSGGFADRLEPLGVRVYAMEIDQPSDRPIQAEISDAAHPGEARKFTSNDDMIRTARARTNLVLNPSMEEQKVPGLPDFYVPYRIIETEEIGVKGSRWFLDAVNPKFGKVSLRMNRYPPAGYQINWRAGVSGVFAEPRNPDRPHVFSFYARAATEGAKLWVGIQQSGKRDWEQRTFSLTGEWQRYFMPAPMAKMKLTHKSAKFLVQPMSLPETDNIIWVDGFQLEEGAEPTEFEP